MVFLNPKTAVTSNSTPLIPCTYFVIRVCTLSLSCTHLCLEECRCNAAIKPREQQSHTVGAKDEYWKRELAHRFSFSAFGVLALRLILPRRSSEGSSKMSQRSGNFPTALCSHFAPILSSEWCIYHARFKKQRRAVLAVLPFVEFWSSGRKCATITIKSFCCQNAVDTTLAL